MPTNLYGQNDNFHPENSHVIPALIRRFHEATLNKQSEVIAWGTGKPMREFLHVDDMADACIHIMNIDQNTFCTNTEAMLSHINIGTGKDCTIKELVQTIAKVVGYKGKIIFDSTKPDGTKRKLLDVSRLSKMGWKATIELEEGLHQTYEWFLKNEDSYRGSNQ